DSNNTKYVATTNCVGNFFVTAEQWNPHFPILVRVTKSNLTMTMKSMIGREASCGQCHSTRVTPDIANSTMPHVYLFGGDEPTGAAKDCPVDPDLGVKP